MFTCSVCVHIFFPLMPPEDHTALQRKHRTNFLQCFSPPCSPSHPNWIFLLPILAMGRAPLPQRLSNDRLCKTRAQGHPQASFLSDCHLPLRQLHFLSSSLGTNSCIPASCRSQEEGCALPKVERNDTSRLQGLLGLFKNTISHNFLQIHQTTLVFAILFQPVSVFRLNDGPFLLWAKRIELLLGLVVRCPAET